MAFSYLTPKNLSSTFKDSEKSMLSVFDPLRDYERIARNKPHPGIDKAYPKVTDGTLASIIQETPKRYIQQLPSGIVHTSEGEWLDTYAAWKLTKDIIPHANCQADVLQKSWRAGSGSMTYGSQPAYVFMDEYNGQLKANFKLPYITHVYLGKGKISDRESNVMFLESWYQESDIDQIIDQEKAMKKEDPDYETEWDVEELEKYKKKKESKSEDQKNPHEADDKESANDDGARIIHAFQTGVGNSFYSFIPGSTDGDAEGAPQIVRTKVNKDPRGAIPIHYLYCNLDLSNPIGRGVVEISGGMQNLLDSHTQAFQYMQALMMNPPIQKWGDIPRGSIKYVPNAVIDMGNSPNNKIDVLNINSSAITNFPATYGLFKSQILNLNNSNDTSISSEVGNPGFSKTDAGVDALNAKLGVSDNYLRKQYETWYEAVCETMLNLTFAEIDGIVEEDLDSKTADKLRKIIPEGNEYVTWVDDNTIAVNYDLLGLEPIYFNVDASTSAVKEDQAQVESLNAAKELVIDMLPVSKRMSLANKFIYKLGIEDPEDITFSEEELAQAQEAEQNPPPEQQQGMQPGMQQGAQQPQLTDEEMELAQGLAERGLPEEQIMQAVGMFREGLPTEQILGMMGLI